MVQQTVFDTMVKLFGGPKNLGAGSLRSYFDFDRVIHEGLPLSALLRAIESLKQPEQTILDGMGMSHATLSPRKRTGRLGFVDSERAVRLGAVIALASIALGSNRAVGRWLLARNSALGGELPIRLLKTDVGARQVEEVLGRALLGSFS
jgi:putative toxin-antitoxin system antitoxin component (TIGR02293 family)